MVLKLELGMEFIDSANPSENARPEQFKLLPLAGDECCACVCGGVEQHTTTAEPCEQSGNSGRTAAATTLFAGALGNEIRK